MKLKRMNIITAGSIFIIVMFISSPAMAASAAREAKKAGRFYQEGKYDEALAEYDKALSIKPDDPRLHYNRAAALYRKDKFQDAGEAFLQSLASGDESMEKKSVYNVGNSRYRAGETAEKADPGSALKNYREAVQYYRRAMELVPEDNDAKYNYEFTMKKIHDLEQRQKEENKEQQKQDQKEQEQNQDQQKKQDQKEQEQDQDQQKKEQQKDQQNQQEKDQDRQKKEEKRDEQLEEKQGAEPQPVPGGMSEEEAERILTGQEEEESRMRIQMKKKRAGRRPVVLKDW